MLKIFASHSYTLCNAQSSINIYYTLTNAIGCSEILLRLIFNADGIGRPSVRHVIICLSNCVASFPVPFPLINEIKIILADYTTPKTHKTVSTHKYP